MGINRRNFFKILGVSGATLMIGKEMKAAPGSRGGIEFRSVLYDSSRCKRCRGCEVDCAEANHLPQPPATKDIPDIRKTGIDQRTVVNVYQTSKGPVNVKVQCMHCNEPACGAACLTQAMHKTKVGPVIWRGEKCMGCRYCMVSCPFDIPKFEYFSSNPKIQKCDMCFGRLKTGEIPACVQNCPFDALMYGTRRELLREAHKRIAENPGQYVDHIYGEREAGGTGWLYLSPVPFNEIGFNNSLQKASYPALTKGFLYSVPSVFVLLPALLLGVQQATKTNRPDEEHEES